MVIARRQTLVQLNEELLATLDRAAGRRGISRSALIREAVSRHLHDEIEAEIGRQIVAGYTRMPQTAEEREWADIGLAEITNRLDDEEDGW